MNTEKQSSDMIEEIFTELCTEAQDFGSMTLETELRANTLFAQAYVCILKYITENGTPIVANTAFRAFRLTGGNAKFKSTFYTYLRRLESLGLLLELPRPAGKNMVPLRFGVLNKDELMNPDLIKIAVEKLKQRNKGGNNP